MCMYRPRLFRTLSSEPFKKKMDTVSRSSLLSITSAKFKRSLASGCTPAISTAKVNWSLTSGCTPAISTAMINGSLASGYFPSSNYWSRTREGRRVFSVSLTQKLGFFSIRDFVLYMLIVSQSSTFPHSLTYFPYQQHTKGTHGVCQRGGKSEKLTISLHLHELKKQNSTWEKQKERSLFLPPTHANFKIPTSCAPDILFPFTVKSIYIWLLCCISCVKNLAGVLFCTE